MNRNFLAELPIRFTENIIGMHAEPGRQWLDILPELIEEIAGKWSLKIDKPFSDLSYNYVAPCVCPNGTKAVLKIGFPEKDSVNFLEAKTLDFVAGEGIVRLLKFDEEFCAMLLERALPGENLIGICKQDDEQATKIAISVMKGFWRVAPENAGFPNLEKWIEGLRSAEDTTFPQKSVKKARDYFTELIASSRQAVLLHGDLHHGNILSAEREAFLAIDPKGIIGDIGYEISVFLNNPRSWILKHSNRKSILRKRIEMFSESCEIEPESLRKWAYAEAVLSAWWTMEDNGAGWEKWLEYAEIWERI
jgi:streptomycin 6-kinase